MFNIAGSSERKCVFGDKFYTVNWFDGLPFRIKTTKMAGAVPTAGYHYSEKELKKEKVGIFYLGAAWILEPGPLPKWWQSQSDLEEPV